MDGIQNYGSKPSPVKTTREPVVKEPSVTTHEENEDEVKHVEADDSALIKSDRTLVDDVHTDETQMELSNNFNL